MAKSYLKYLTEEEQSSLAQPTSSAAEPTTSSPTTPQEGGENMSLTVEAKGDQPFFSGINDILVGASGGVVDAIKGTLNAPADIAETVGLIGKDTAESSREVVSRFLPDVMEQDSTAGEITRGIVKYGIGFIGVGKITGGLKIAQALKQGGFASRAVLGAAQGAVGDALVSDPEDGRLADLIKGLPILGQNAIVEYLATDKTDSRAEARFKAALDGIVPGVLLDGVLHVGVKAYKNAKLLRAAGKPEAADKVIAEAGEQIDETLQRIGDKPLPEELPKSVTGKQYDIADTTLFAGNRRGPLMQPDDEMLVARKGGEDLGFIHVTKKEGGFEVRKIEVLPEARKQGVARQLYQDASERWGTYLGSTDRTEMGEKLVTALKKSDPEIFAGKPPAMGGGAAAMESGVAAAAGPTGGKPKNQRPAFQMDDTARAAFRENIRDHVLRGSDLDLPLEGTVFNYSTMKSAEDVHRVIDDLAQTAGEGLKDARGTFKSQEMTKDVADALNIRPEVFRANLSRRAAAVKDLDSYLVSAKVFVQSQARDIADLAKRLEFGTAGPQAEVELARRIDILADTMNDLGAIQTGAARTTAAGRIRTADSVSPDQIAKLLDDSSSEEVRKMAAKINMAGGNTKGIIAAVRPATMGEKAMAVHNFVWINSILSGFKTTGINLLSTAVNTLIRPAQRFVGGAGSALITGDTRQMKEAVYQYAGLYHSIFDSAQMALKAWNLDRGILDIQNASSEIMGRPLSAKYLGIEASPYAHGIDFLGKVVGIPGKFLNSQDEFFKQINYRSFIMARAWAESDEMIQKGLLRPGMEAEYAAQRMAESIGHMGQALDKPALLAAQEATFTQPLKRDTLFSLHGRNMSELIGQLGSHPVLKGTILPFVKVPTNLMRTFADTGPLALVQKHFYTELNAGGERQAMALGKLGTGVMLWTGATMLALSGRITGAGPRDADLQRQRRQNRWQPYSFVFNNDDGTKSYLNFGRLDPIAYIFGIAGDWAEMSGKLDGTSAESFATDMTVALAQSISSKTYLRGVIDVMAALGGGYDNEDRVRRLVQYRLGSYVPSILGIANPDDTLKQVRSIGDAFLARIPGFSDSVEAKRDNFGMKMEAPMGYPWNAINPFTFTTTSGDRVREELMALATTRSEAMFPVPAQHVANGTIDLADPQLRNPKTGQTAHDRWLELLGEKKLGGKTLHESLGDLIGSSSYQAARGRMGEGDPTYKRSMAVDLIKSRMKMYHDIAFLQVRKEYPDLDKAMNDFLINTAKGRISGPSAITPNPLIQR